MKLNKIGEVWNSANRLLSDFISLLSSKNFATMATWQNDFSSHSCIKQKMLYVHSYDLLLCLRQPKGIKNHFLGLYIQSWRKVKDLHRNLKTFQGKMQFKDSP